MGEVAKVNSIETLKAFRVALIKFVEAANVSLADAESDISRTIAWLERDQSSYWRLQLAKRQESLERAKEQLRMKRLFKDASGRPQPAVEEEKAVRVWTARVEEAQQKLAAIKKYLQLLPREQTMYKGQVQRLATNVQSMIPMAVAELDRIAAALDRYVGYKPEFVAGEAGLAGSTAGGEGEGPSMRRSIDPLAAADASDQSGFAAARRSTPRPAERAAAPAGEAADLAKALGPINADAARVLADRRVPDFEWPADATLTFAVGEGGRVYLDRADRAGGADSGWYAGHPHAADGARLYHIPIAALLSARPDLRDLLALPAGWMVVIDPAAGVVAVLSDRDQLAWAPPPPPAVAPPAVAPPGSNA